jgi:radical SAM-linked protein
MHRLFRRAEVPLAMSQGFHPKPRISFPLALAVGVEGLDEIVELQLAAPIAAERLSARLNENSVPGLVFRRVELLPEGVPKAAVCSARYAIALPPERRADTAERIERLAASREYFIQRPRRSQAIDLRAHLVALNLEDDGLAMKLRVSREANAGPRDVLAALGLDGLEEAGYVLRRTAVELE